MSAITVDSGRAVSPVGGGNRSSAIDGIRGLAALALLTIHVGMFSGLLGTKAFGTPRPPSNVFGAFFVSGMPSFIGVFFVLPAFFLYLPLAKAIIAGTRRPAQGRGLVRRLIRLLPAYYLMVLVTLVTLNRDAIDGIGFVLRPFLLLQVYLPSPFVPKMINGMEISWTVPSMVQWYLFLPLIAWATHRFAARGATPAIRARRLMLPVPILIAIGVGWLFFVKAHGWDNRIVFWWPPGFAHTIGIGMALAIMLAKAQVSPGETPRIFRLAAARPYLFWFGAVLVYLVNCARPFSVIGMDAIYSVSGLLVTYLMVATFGFLAVLPLIAPGGRPHAVTTFLGSRPIAYVGKVSYGIYLWHFAVMHFYLQPEPIFGGHAKPIRELYGTAGFWELELITVAGAILIASLSYHLLEQPMVALGEHFLRYRKRTEPAVEKTPVAEKTRAAAEPTDEASTAVLAAGSDRDAIRANLVELEASLGHQLLAGADLTGETRRRWETAAADLSQIWEIFAGYSAVLDQAAEVLSRVRRRPSAADTARISELLTEPSILLTTAPIPLTQRHITDPAHTRLTPQAAVDRMNTLFQRTAELFTLVESIWQALTPRLDALPAGPDADRLRTRLATDPLSFWQHGHIDTAELDSPSGTASRAA